MYSKVRSLEFNLYQCPRADLALGTRHAVDSRRRNGSYWFWWSGASKDGSSYRRNTTMNWLSSNWIWLALGVGVFALFASGQGGCGMGHGGHGRREEADQYGRPGDKTTAPLSTSHVHDAPSLNQSALGAEHTGHDTNPSQAQRQPHRHGC